MKVRKVRSSQLILPFALVLHSGVPAWAQRTDGFRLTTPLSLSAGYDDNFVTSSQVLDDTVSILTSPTLSWTRSTHRTNFSVDYEPEFEIFSRHQDLNAWNHSATLRFNQRINGRMTFEAGDSFLSTMDPSRRLVDSLLLLPRGRFRQNVLYAGLGYRLDRRTTLSFHFDNAIATMALPAALAGRLDQLSSAGTASLDRTVNRNHALSASYSYLRFRPLNAAVSGSVAMQNLNLGYVYTVNPGLIVRLSGGLIRGHQSEFTGTAAVEKRLSGVWVAAGYQRYLGFFGGLAPNSSAPAGAIPFANGLAPSSLFQVASLRVWGKLSKRIGVEGTALKVLNGLNPQGQAVNSLAGHVRLDYKLAERLTVFARAELYSQNVNDFSPLPLSRRRYFGGLEIALSHPRESVNVSRRPGEGSADSADSTGPEADEPHGQEER